MKSLLIIVSVAVYMAVCFWLLANLCEWLDKTYPNHLARILYVITGMFSIMFMIMYEIIEYFNIKL